MYNDNEPSILCTDECYFNFGAYPDSDELTDDAHVSSQGGSDDASTTATRTWLL